MIGKSCQSINPMNHSSDICAENRKALPRRRNPLPFILDFRAGLPGWTCRIALNLLQDERLERAYDKCFP